MTDTVFVSGLALHAYHGVMQHEAKVGQTLQARPDARHRPHRGLAHRQARAHGLLRPGGETASARVLRAALPAGRGRRRRGGRGGAGASSRRSRGARHRAQAACADRRHLRRCRRLRCLRQARDKSAAGEAMAEALLALGGNVGDVRDTFDRAISHALRRWRHPAHGALVRLRTPPWGVVDQPPFVNRCHCGRDGADAAGVARARAGGRARVRARPRARSAAGGRVRSTSIFWLMTISLSTPRSDAAASAPVRARVRAGAAGGDRARRVIAGTRGPCDTVKRLRCRGSALDIEKLLSPAVEGCGRRARQLHGMELVGEAGARCGPRRRAQNWTQPPTAEFPPATGAAMAQAGRRRAQGRAIRPRLVAKTYDGLTIDPLYARGRMRSRSAGRTPGAPGRSSSASIIPIRQPPTPRRCTTSRTGRPACRWCSPVRSAPMATGSTPSETHRPRARGVHLDAGIALDLDLRPSDKGAGALIAGLVKRRGIRPARADIRFGFDPIGAAAIAGSARSWERAHADLNAAISDLRRGISRTVRTRGRTGDSQCRRLGGAGTRLRARRRRRLPACAGERTASRSMPRAPHDLFPAAADADQFLTMAKFRARGNCGRASSRPAG